MEAGLCRILLPRSPELILLVWPAMQAFYCGLLSPPCLLNHGLRRAGVKFVTNLFRRAQQPSQDQTEKTEGVCGSGALPVSSSMPVDPSVRAFLYPPAHILSQARLGHAGCAGRQSRQPGSRSRASLHVPTLAGSEGATGPEALPAPGTELQVPPTQDSPAPLPCSL